MTTLLLTQPEVRALLSMAECLEIVSDALEILARGHGTNPLRRGMRLPDGLSLLGTMPGSLHAPGKPPVFGLKVVTVFPGNHATPYDGHQGVVVIFDPANGTPRGIFDASEITSIRTAAASGVATRLLAREDAGDLAILGSGVEARTHLEAMSCVRSLRRVRVHSPNRERLLAFAERESKRLGLRVEPTDSAREAVEGADIVCTTTSSPVPVLEGAWLAPGAHVNAVGACLKDTRELDTEAIVRSRVYTDRRESAWNESGELLIPLAEGAIGRDHLVGEIGEVLIGACPGRRSPEEITLFDSLGIAVEDVAVAEWLDARARAAGVGTMVALGGLRDA